MKEDGRRYFILSLADSRTKTIAQIVLNEEVAAALRDAIDKLLSGQIEEGEGGERAEAKEAKERERRERKEKREKEEDVMFV